MKYRLFFADYCEGKHLDVGNAREANTDEILHSTDCVLHYPGNYIGIIDENDTTLQFIVNDDLSIQLDIPCPDIGGSYVKTTNLPECLAILRYLTARISAEDIDGLQFQSW